MINIRLLQLLVSICAVICLCLLVSCKGKVMKVSEGQVEDRIKNQLPDRATKAQVEEFIDSLTINNLKPIRYEYMLGVPGSSSMDAPEVSHSTAAGHIIARIENVGDDDTQWLTYEMRIVFFFDKNERLLAHQIRVFGHGL